MKNLTGSEGRCLEYELDRIFNAVKSICGYILFILENGRHKGSVDRVWNNSTFFGVVVFSRLPYKS